MREVRLYGHLGKKFGKVHRFDVKSPAEAISALKANFKDFEKHVIENSLPGYHVFVGNTNIGVDDMYAWSGKNVIKIVPAVEGAKKGGLLQTIIGVVLMAVGVMTGTPFVTRVGFMLSLGGMAQMLARAPNADTKERPENQPSYTFNGPVNTSAQGNAVPILYGELIVGSQIISAGLSVDQIAVNNPAPPPAPPSGPNQLPWDAPYGGSFDRAYM